MRMEMNFIHYNHLAKLKMLVEKLNCEEKNFLRKKSKESNEKKNT
jgi:hypothetical protein